MGSAYLGIGMHCKLTIMKQIAIILFYFFIVTCQIAYTQNSEDRWIMGKERMEKLLKESLSDTSVHNYVITDRILLKDEKKAIGFAENVLFDIYGKDEIIDQRPYEIYFIDYYWIIKGTLPKTCVGGTFLIIIDSRDYRIVRISHGQ
jgi:hypothetical protein